MATLADTLFSKIASHAGASGLFERVNTHEPKSAPPSQQGITCAIWLQGMDPLGRASGLAETSGLITFMLRIYTNFVSQPEDIIDPRITDAMSRLMEAYSGDFTLGGNVRQIDLLGAYGPGLSAKAGYLEQDRKMYRIMDLTIPVVVNDLWSQVS